MSNHLLLWIFKLIYFLLALTLLFFINSSPDLDSGFYLLGGSCSESALAVTGQFNLTFRLLLIITDLLVLSLSLKLLWTKSWSCLVVGTGIVGSFVVINQLWTQKHLFQGYEWPRSTDFYDAVMRKCYIFDGPQYGVLLATCLVCLWGLLELSKKN